MDVFSPHCLNFQVFFPSAPLVFDSQVVGVFVIGDDPGHLPVPRCQVPDFVLIRSELRETQTGSSSGVGRFDGETCFQKYTVNCLWLIYIHLTLTTCSLHEKKHR